MTDIIVTKAAPCETHTLTTATPAAAGKHTGTCSVCGESVTEACTGNHNEACSICGFTCSGSKTTQKNLTDPVWMESDGVVEYDCKTCGRFVSTAPIPAAPQSVALTVNVKTAGSDDVQSVPFTVSQLNDLIQTNSEGYRYGSYYVTEYIDVIDLLTEAGAEVRPTDTISFAASDGFSYSETVDSLQNTNCYFVDNGTPTKVPAVIGVKWGSSVAESYYSGNLRDFLGIKADGSGYKGNRLVSYVTTITLTKVNPNVAAIGDVQYTSLTEALAAAQAGETVTLLKDITDEAYILVLANVTLDLAGHNITDATLFYVTGTLTDSGESKGCFSAQVYSMNQSANSAMNTDMPFPVYDSATGTYSLYTMSLWTNQSGSSYQFAFKSTNDRTAAVDQMKADKAQLGRVQAILKVTWTEGNGSTAVTIVKNFLYSNAYMSSYLGNPGKNAFSASLTKGDNVVGSVSVQPMFVTYDANGAVMMTLTGAGWTIK